MLVMKTLGFSQPSAVLIANLDNGITGKTSGNVKYIKEKGISVEGCRRIAYDYLKSDNNKAKSIPYFEYLLTISKTYNVADIRSLAEAYFYNDQFGLAVNLQTQYINKIKNGKLKRIAKKKLKRYKKFKNSASHAKNIKIINLGPSINSKYAEINPFVSNSENILVYSSKKYDNYDIYVSKKRKNQYLWDKSKLVGNSVNTVNDEFVAGLSDDGNTMLVHYNEDNGFEDINKATQINGLYQELDNLGTSVNSVYKEEGVCYSKSDDTLFFASNRAGGYGGMDLYYALRISNGLWGQPINMGPVINTKADENYPSFDPDGSTFYFASKGHGSIGGYDIFYSKWNTDKNGWIKPENMGYPINNTFDNRTIRFTKNPRYAYISSITNKGMGDYDIYKVVFLDQEADYLIIKGNVFVKDLGDVIPFNEFEQSISISTYKDNSIFGIYALNNVNNTFVLAVNPGTYYLKIEADGFKPIKKKFTIKENHYRNKKRKINIYLETEKENGQKIKLDKFEN